MVKTVWSSDGMLDNYMDMSFEEKKNLVKDWYQDEEMLAGIETEQELNDIISDNPDIYDNAAIDFQDVVAPMIEDQFFNGLILDEKFNFVKPEKLLDFDGYYAELVQDDNKDLFFDVEGRKSFPILGFSKDKDEMVAQVDQLGILDILRDLYPDHEDEDFLDMYYIGDMIPFNWELLSNTLTHAKNVSGIGECVEQPLDEAKAKNPSKFAAELAEIKEMIEEDGFEQLFTMPFTREDGDEISVEAQYPEFFRIMKSFWKEMGLDGDLDDLWSSEFDLYSSQPSDFKRDWNTLMDACDKLVQGNGVQFEKIYKNYYNSPVDELDKNESLQEDTVTQVGSLIGENNAEDFLEYLKTHDCETVGYFGDEPVKIEEDDNSFKIRLYSQASDMTFFFNNDGTVDVYGYDDDGDIQTEFDEHFKDYKEFCKWYSDNSIAWTSDLGYDLWRSAEAMEESINKPLNEDISNIKQLVNQYLMDDLFDWGDNLAYKIHDAIPEYNPDWCNDDGTSAYADRNQVTEEQYIGAMLDLLFANAPKDESLNEDAAEEIAMHGLKEEVANYIYEFYLADVDDNIAQAVHAAIPQYDIDWCNEEGDNFVANGVDQMKHALARKIADALFANAPRELGESLIESAISSGSELFMTRSWGGMEGRTVEERYFTSEEAAVQNAEKDTWNDGFSLYKIIFTDIGDGQLDQKEEFIRKLESGNDTNESLNESINSYKGYLINITPGSYLNYNALLKDGTEHSFNTLEECKAFIDNIILSGKDEYFDVSVNDLLTANDIESIDESLNEADGNDWPWGDPKVALPKKKEPAEDTSLDNLID